MQEGTTDFVFAPEDTSASDSSNQLERFRSRLLRDVLKIRDQVRTARKEHGYVERNSILDKLRNEVRSSGELPLNFPLEAFDIEFIERSNFGADITFRSTKLISQDKVSYLKEYCPQLVESLQRVKFGGGSLFEEVKMVGIYVNVRLSPIFFFQRLEGVLSLGEKYGESDVGVGRDIVIDYSSPNAAKHLHAGHIRSTIIGHVLGNMYDACGYAVHRVNYLNDWGGMGVLIEGIRVMPDQESYENKNDLLFRIYSAFRASQKAVADQSVWEWYSSEQKLPISQLIGESVNYSEFLKNYEAFLARSNDAFSALERGDDVAYSAWEQIVSWSLQDFERFYAILGIHQDYLTGEGLYAKSGKDLVMYEVEKGGIRFFDEIQAKEALNQVNREREASGMTDDAYARAALEIQSDVGCYVVPLDKGERFVVLKRDGSTIYATRDLAALSHRFQVFNPSKIIYEVGQEQQEHFDKLFRSARVLGLVHPETELAHIYHGFYVDATSKKKLSSRDGASNIMKLLTDTVAYFRSKYSEDQSFSEAEKDRIAHTLGVGSIIFNDIKKDKKASVPVSSDFASMMQQFEESGWAYVIYASCRAKSILRKYGKELPDVSRIDLKDFTDVEVDLMKRMLTFQDVVMRAMTNDDPVRIAEYITQLAAQFNSYYNSTPILKGDRTEQRLIIISCVTQIIDNGLRILHVGSLDRI